MFALKKLLPLIKLCEVKQSDLDKINKKKQK